MQELYLDIETGSSPRTRGTVLIVPSCCHWLRFIPAHAGNSLNLTC